jgi:hypothetical protein
MCLRYFYSLLLCIPIGIEAQSPCSDTPVATIVEEMPYLMLCDTVEGSLKEKINCSDRAIITHVYDNLSAESIDINSTPSTNAFFSFTIDTNGTICNIKTIKGINKDFDRHFIQIIQSLPPWIPARNRGQKVAIKKLFPIRFHLK